MIPSGPQPVVAGRTITVESDKPNQTFTFKTGDILGPVAILTCTILATAGDRDKLTHSVGNGQMVGHQPNTDGLKFTAVGDGTITFIAQKTC